MNTNQMFRYGNIYGADKGTSFAGNVYNIEYLCPTINTSAGGNRMPLIIIKGDTNGISKTNTNY